MYLQKLYFHIALCRNIPVTPKNNGDKIFLTKKKIEIKFSYRKNYYQYQNENKHLYETIHL